MDFVLRQKKLCVSVVFVVITVIATFTSNKIGHAVFVAGTVIPLVFWFLDAIGYYYQVKLRTLMENIREQIATRNSKKEIIVKGKPFIAKDRVVTSDRRKVFSSFFNHSMWIYGVIIGLDLVVWVLFYLGMVS